MSNNPEESVKPDSLEPQKDMSEENMKFQETSSYKLEPEAQDADLKQQEDFIHRDEDFDYNEPYDAITQDLEKQAKKSNRRSVLFDLIFYALLIFVCVYIIPNYVVQRTVVDGTSMEDTLHDKDQLYVEKLSYHFNALKRFDIIVFYPYGRAEEDYYVKRIIGLPGETVQIIGSDIYINNKKLEEHYGKEPITDPGRAAQPIKLGADEYFVLGDNRDVSKDSRYEVVGNVERKNIGGRVILRIKPFSEFGPVH